MRKDYSKLLWGLIVLAIGIIFAGNVLDLWYINIFFPGWWTLFLIIPGIFLILRDGPNTGSIILVILGIVLLSDCLDVFDARIVWRLIIPIGIIAIGISLIISFFKRENRKEKIGVNESEKYVHQEEYNYKNNYKYDTDEYANYSSVFGSGEFKNVSSDLKGIKVEGVFGAVTLDLREANFNSNVTIEINTVFAGIDIYVPENVQVITVSSTPIFGGVTVRKNKDIPDMPKVKIKYVAIFGGIDIK